MTFAGRVVVLNGGRIEQIGRPRAKREPSPNQSVSLMVPRGGVPWASNINAVRWQTAACGSFDPQRLSGAVSNPPPGAADIHRVPYKTGRAGMSNLSNRAKAKRTIREGVARCWYRRNSKCRAFCRDRVTFE